jgi:uncharacterized membrane protein YdbT with pleckstrin-like domain
MARVNFPVPARGGYVSYAEKHLIEGEQVQYETKLHWIVMIGHVVMALIFAAAGVALLLYPWRSVADAQPYLKEIEYAGFAGLAIAVIIFFVGSLARNATEMAVTNKRVIVKTGIANRRTVEMLLPRIESVVVEEPLAGRMLGYGTVIVRGTGGTPEVFPRIAHPLRFREKVQSQIAGQGKPV